MTEIITRESERACIETRWAEASGRIHAADHYDKVWSKHRFVDDAEQRYFFVKVGYELPANSYIQLGLQTSTSTHCSVYDSHPNHNGAENMTGKLFKGVVVLTKQVPCGPGLTTGVAKSEILYESPTFIAVSEEMARGIIIASALDLHPGMDFNDPCAVVEIQFIVK